MLDLEHRRWDRFDFVCKVPDRLTTRAAEVKQPILDLRDQERNRPPLVLVRWGIRLPPPLQNFGKDFLYKFNSFFS